MVNGAGVRLLCLLGPGFVTLFTLRILYGVGATVGDVSAGPFLVANCRKPSCFYSHRGRATSLVSTLGGNEGVALVDPHHVKGAKLVGGMFCCVRGRGGSTTYFCLSVFSARGLRRFMSLLKQDILKGLSALSRDALGSLFSFFGDYHPIVDTSRVAKVPSMALSFVPRHSRRALGRVFACLGRSKMRYCVTVSRFRRVVRCPRGKIRNLLESCVRFAPGIRFVFSNDGGRLVRSVFFSVGEPFCRSARGLFLTPVPCAPCQRFTGGLFSREGGALRRGVFRRVCRSMGKRA